MKKLLALLFLCTFISLDCMQKNSPPRSHLIPLPEEFTVLQSFMDSPPRLSRSSHDSDKKITYLDDYENLVEVKKVFYVSDSQSTISVKKNIDFAVVLSSRNTPFAAAQFMQWSLSKHPAKVNFIAHGFDQNAGPSDDSISFIFRAQSHGKDEILLTKPAFTEDELDAVNIEITIE